MFFVLFVLVCFDLVLTWGLRALLNICLFVCVCVCVCVCVRDVSVRMALVYFPLPCLVLCWFGLVWFELILFCFVLFRFVCSVCFGLIFFSFDCFALPHLFFLVCFCLVFHGDISKWDVSSVTNIRVADMNDMFKNAAAFHGDISKWDYRPSLT